MSEIMQITGNTDNIAYQHPHDAGADLKSCEDTTKHHTPQDL